MRRILLAFIISLSVSGCAENMWRFSDASTKSKSLTSNSNDLLAPRGAEDDGTKPGYFHSFNHIRIEEFLEKAEQRKSEIMQTSSGESITLRYTKSYISAENHLCKLFSLSKTANSEDQQAFDNVFCRINDRWVLLESLNNRDMQRELFNALKDTFPQQEAS